MKKTISSSIGGIVFNIEEDAHAKLSSYLDAISASLKSSEGHDEIMADIESRIAEILQQKLGSYKQVVSLAEVDEVVGIMGNPEDFGAAPSGAKEQAYSSSSAGNQYGAWGRRRVYRDGDDKIVCGVCAGLSHHFGIDPLWLRLAFALALLSGFGFILYILLAIILPKARTSAEKLEMMGEPVDVNNIRKIIEEDLNDLKKKVKDFGGEIKNGRGRDRAKEFGKDMGDFFSSVGHGTGNLIGGVFKAILLFIAFIITIVFIGLLVALIVSLTSGVNIIHLNAGNHQMVHYSILSLFDMLSITGGMRTLLITGLFLFLGIPLLAIIVRFGRMAAGRKQPYQWFTVTASVLWAAGWILMFIGATAVISHFSVTDSTRNEVNLTIQPAKTLYVKMENEQVGEMIFDDDSRTLYVSSDNEFKGNPSLCIEQSPDTNYHLVLTKIARGITKAEADDFANNIDYSYYSHDSTLKLDHYFSLEMNKGWRKQKLDLLLEVPLNKSIALPDGIDRILCHALKRKGQHIGGSTWTMSETGLVPYNKL